MHFCRKGFAFTWEICGGNGSSARGDGLGDSGAGEAEDWDAVFRGACGADEGVEFVLGLTPFDDVHGWEDEELGALFDEVIDDAGVAEIITDAEADFAPGGIPDALFGRGEAVVEELNGDGFDLFENDFAVRIDDEGGVVEVCAGGIFAAGDQVFFVLLAPFEDARRDGAVEGVFTEHKQFGFRMLLNQQIEFARNFQRNGKFQLDSGNVDRILVGRPCEGRNWGHANQE